MFIGLPAWYAGVWRPGSWWCGCAEIDVDLVAELGVTPPVLTSV
ncbi:hypothetical protein AB4305_09865 [Nocardia sp. 2YAB30]